jgi:protoporphyrinogen oxidase
MYRKPLRTPTRRLRIACIGAGISAMNLAYKIYHERQDLNCELVVYEGREDMGGTVGYYSAGKGNSGNSCYVSVVGQHVPRSRLRRPSSYLVRESLLLLCTGTDRFKARSRSNQTPTGVRSTHLVVKSSIISTRP